MATLSWTKTTLGYKAKGTDGATYVLLKTPGRRYILRVNDAEHGKQGTLVEKKAEAQKADDDLEDLVAEVPVPKPIAHGPAVVMSGTREIGMDEHPTAEQVRKDQEAAKDLRCHNGGDYDRAAFGCCDNPDCPNCYGSGVVVNAGPIKDPDADQDGVETVEEPTTIEPKAEPEKPVWPDPRVDPANDPLEQVFPEDYPRPELPPLPPPAGSHEPPVEYLPPLPPPAGTDDPKEAPPVEDRDPFAGLYERVGTASRINPVTLPETADGRPVVSWLA